MADKINAVKGMNDILPASVPRTDKLPDSALWHWFENTVREVLAEVVADPESETYQFVVRAVLHDGDAELANLAARAVALQTDLERERARRVLAEAELEQAAAEAASLRPLLDEAVAHAHGFEALTDLLFCYHVTEEYDASDPDENAIAWNDPRVAHLWSTSSPILSQRDLDASS